MQTYLTQKTVVRLGVLGILAALALTVFAGCGSEEITYTIKPVTPATMLPANTSEVPRETTSTPAPPPSNPVVHFSSASWPFTAQLASVELSSSGAAGSSPVPPPHEYLLVKVNITSLVTDRPVQPPGVTVRCHAPGDHSWTLNETEEGYDEGSEAPSVTGLNIPMNDGQPHPWDVEWEVPENTSTASIKCVLLPEKGSLKLN